MILRPPSLRRRCGLRRRRLSRPAKGFREVCRRPAARPPIPAGGGIYVSSGNKENEIVADDALSRARKARQQLPSPKSGAVVPAGSSARNNLIALAKAAVARPAPAAPVVQVAPSGETKGTALVARVRDAAARPVPVRPKPPEPPKIVAPVPVVAPAPVPIPVPTKQVVPVQIAPDQIVPVEIPQNAAGAQSPINVVVNVVNEQRGPYWGWPYWYGCGRLNCPHLRGLPCNRWLCF